MFAWPFTLGGLPPVEPPVSMRRVDERAKRGLVPVAERNAITRE
jgi:hypothetical protein